MAKKKTVAPTISPGVYTVQEIFDLVGFTFDFDDYRRVKVGGLGFDDLDRSLRIPEGASVVEIQVDGETTKSITVS